MVLFLSPQNLVAPYLLQNRVVFPIYSRSSWPSPFYFRTSWPSSFPLRTSWFSPFLLQNHMDLFLSPQNLVVLSRAATPRFKSQCPSSFPAPFPTPPTVSYTCQHPRILPAFLSCHSKSGQVWPHGMEPIISKLLCGHCNQGELLPSPILGGIWSHPPAQSMATAT